MTPAENRCRLATLQSWSIRQPVVTFTTCILCLPSRLGLPVASGWCNTRNTIALSAAGSHQWESRVSAPRGVNTGGLEGRLKPSRGLDRREEDGPSHAAGRLWARSPDHSSFEVGPGDGGGCKAVTLALRRRLPPTPCSALLSACSEANEHGGWRHR
jgi:hypothetical protein